MIRGVLRATAVGDVVADATLIAGLVPNGLFVSIAVAYALGAIRILRFGALVQQSNAIESLSHVDVLCLDKTGTLTANRLEVEAVAGLGGASEDEVVAALTALAASTTAGNKTSDAIAARWPAEPRRARRRGAVLVGPEVERLRVRRCRRGRCRRRRAGDRGHRRRAVPAGVPRRRRPGRAGVVGRAGADGGVVDVARPAGAARGDPRGRVRAPDVRRRGGRVTALRDAGARADRAARPAARRGRGDAAAIHAGRCRGEDHLRRRPGHGGRAGAPGGPGRASSSRSPGASSRRWTRTSSGARPARRRSSGGSRRRRRSGSSMRCGHRGTTSR